VRGHDGCARRLRRPTPHQQDHGTTQNAPAGRPAPGPRYAAPQQIAGWLKLTYPDHPELQVSHESIYRTLYVQSRGALNRELTAFLRTGRTIRRPAGVRVPDGRGGRLNTLNISQRPAEVADRAVPGHWEGDLVFAKGMSPVATLVERTTRYLMLVALPSGDHKADAVPTR
jgi:IS30 family transposase